MEFEFIKDGAFLKGNATISGTIDAADSAAIAAALRDDTAFPTGTLHFAGVAARASAVSGEFITDLPNGTDVAKAAKASFTLKNIHQASCPVVWVYLPRMPLRLNRSGFHSASTGDGVGAE